MKWVLITPVIDIQPRAISSQMRAYVSMLSPAPPHCSSIAKPKKPSSFIFLTIASG